MSVRLCLIGCGRIVQGYHGPALQTLAERGEIELAACCDLEEAAARRVQNEVGFTRADTDLGVMLDRERPDAVVVAVPDTAVGLVAGQVLSRGLPVMLEKPPARTLAELDGLIALARDKGVLTQVAFNRRFAPVLVELKRRLGEGAPAQCLQGWMVRDNRRDVDFTTTAIHLLDAVRFVLDDDYAALTLRYREWSAGGAAVTNYYVDGVMVGGAAVQLCICPAAGMVTERLIVRCAQRTLEAEMPVAGDERQRSGTLTEWVEGQLASTTSGRALAQRGEAYAVNGMLPQVTDFVRAVQEKRKTAIDLAGARQSMEVMLALRERATTYTRGV